MEQIHDLRLDGDIQRGDRLVAYDEVRLGGERAGPLFEGDEQSFFNLELADTNVVDHHTSDLVARYGGALRLRG